MLKIHWKKGRHKIQFLAISQVGNKTQKVFHCNNSNKYLDLDPVVI